MKTRAAVAFEAKQPLEIVELDLEGPKAGEVLVEIKATGICHTDAYTLDGLDQRRHLSRRSWATRARAWCSRSGPGVTSVKPGDHVIPLYTPECRQCKSCLSRKTNLCTAIRATQGKGLMPDGTAGSPTRARRSPLHGLLDLLELHRAARDRGGQDPRRRAVRQGLLHRLRRHHRRRRGGQHREGRAGRQLSSSSAWAASGST